MFTAPVSLEISLVSEQRHRSIVATESLIFTDDVQVSGSLVEARSTDDRVDDDECARPLEITLRLLVRLYTHTQGLFTSMYIEVYNKSNKMPCYRRENRAIPLQISIRIEFYNGIVPRKLSLRCSPNKKNKMIIR